MSPVDQRLAKDNFQSSRTNWTESTRAPTRAGSKDTSGSPRSSYSNNSKSRESSPDPEMPMPEGFQQGAALTSSNLMLQQIGELSGVDQRKAEYWDRLRFLSTTVQDLNALMIEHNIDLDDIDAASSSSSISEYDLYDDFDHQDNRSEHSNLYHQDYIAISATAA